MVPSVLVVNRQTLPYPSMILSPAHPCLRPPQFARLVSPFLAAGYLSKSPHVRPYLPNFEAKLI